MHQIFWGSKHSAAPPQITRHLQGVVTTCKNWPQPVIWKPSSPLECSWSPPFSSLASGLVSLPLFSHERCKRPMTSHMVRAKTIIWQWISWYALGFLLLSVPKECIYLPPRFQIHNLVQLVKKLLQPGAFSGPPNSWQSSALGQSWGPQICRLVSGHYWCIRVKWRCPLLWYR